MTQAWLVSHNALEALPALAPLSPGYDLALGWLPQLLGLKVQSHNRAASRGEGDKAGPNR